MKKQSAGKNSLEFTIWNQLFEGKPSKGQRTQLSIVEAAIRLYAKQGVHATTYDLIAKEAEVSRPLVIKYFPSYDDLFEFVANYLRAKFQMLAVDRIRKAATPFGQLTAYIDANFEGVLKHPKESKVWLYFYYKAALEKKYKRLNTGLVDIGTRRIEAMIEAGREQGVFSAQDTAFTARAIQVHLTGVLISILSEDRLKQMPEFVASAHQVCLQLAGYKG